MNFNRVARVAAAAVLAITLLATLSACSPRTPSGPNGGDRTVVAAPIDEIDILVRESSPPGYTAHIISGLPSGCALFHEARITARAGDTITISVSNTVPSDPEVACRAIYTFHETNIDLGQDLVSGRTYTVKVNDEQTNFIAQ